MTKPIPKMDQKRWDAIWKMTKGELARRVYENESDRTKLVAALRVELLEIDLSDLGISFAKLAEAVMIVENKPCNRRFTDEELTVAIEAVRQINAAKQDRTEEK